MQKAIIMGSPLVRATAATALLMSLAACGGAPPGAGSVPPPPEVRVLPNASSEAAPAGEDSMAFRARPPPAGVARPFEAPSVEERQLRNGVRVVVARRPGLPIVAVELVSDGVPLDAPEGLPALASRCLLAGTRTRSAEELAAAWSQLGTALVPSANADSMSLRFEVLAHHLDPALALVGEMVASPALPPPEVARRRRLIASGVVAGWESPDRRAESEALTLLFGNGRYGRTPEGRPGAVERRSLPEVKAYLTQALRPEALSIIVAGDITPDGAFALADRYFGGLTPRPGPPRAAVPPPAVLAAAPSPGIVLVDRPGLAQSVVRVVAAGPPRGASGFAVAGAAAAVLSGPFSSRLNLSLREKHGYTYFVAGSLDGYGDASLFHVSGSIVREKTAPALREMLTEIDRLTREPPSADELALAQRHLTVSLEQGTTRVAGVASVLRELRARRVPLRELTEWHPRVAGLTAEAVREAAAGMLPRDRLRIVVVGDAAVIRHGLEALGVGAVRVLPSAAASPR